MTHYITNVAAIAALDAVVALIDAGTAALLKIYAGTVPDDADAALSGETLLATLTFSATSFPGASDGAPGATSTANAITDDTSAAATGTAAYYRITDSAGLAVTQGTVGTSGANLNLSTVSITAGDTVSVAAQAFDLTHPES